MSRSRPFLVGALSLPLSLLLAAGACTGKAGDAPKPKPKPAAAKAGPAFDTPADPMAAINAIGETRFVVAVSPDDPARGSDTPLVTAVVFSDFECPFCGKLAKTLDTVMPEYEADVRLVFKHYPLANHARAEPAAKAAVAAHAQGKFWPMHDALFANRTALQAADLHSYATNIGLDIAKFTADAQRKSTTIKVNEQFADGRVLQVTTTPTMFVNGRLIKGAKPVEEFRLVFDEEIAAAKAMVAAGVDRADVYATIMKQATPGAGKRPNRDPTHRRGEASKRTNYAISVAEHNPTRGPDDALVTIVEYNAFDCEACAAIQPHLTALLAKYPKDVRVVWRHFPDGRPKAVAAAGAAAAALSASSGALSAALSPALSPAGAVLAPLAATAGLPLPLSLPGHPASRPRAIPKARKVP